MKKILAALLVAGMLCLSACGSKTTKFVVGSSSFKAPSEWTQTTDTESDPLLVDYFKDKDGNEIMSVISSTDPTYVYIFTLLMGEDMLETYKDAQTGFFDENNKVPYLTYTSEDGTRACVVINAITDGKEEGFDFIFSSSLDEATIQGILDSLSFGARE